MRRQPQQHLSRAGRSPDKPGRWRPAAVLAALLALVGCDIFQAAPPPPCPAATVLRDASELVRYRPGPGRDLIDVVTLARVAGISVECDYDDDQVEVEVTIDLLVEQGPAATATTVALPYFVAVVDAGQRILAKEVFTSQIEFPSDRRRVGVREETEQDIPLAPGQSGTSFEILIGFQLSRQELEDLRRRNR